MCVGISTYIAESVDGALDYERARDEDSEHGGDRPRRRERQRPHLPLAGDRGRGGPLAARHPRFYPAGAEPAPPKGAGRSLFFSLSALLLLLLRNNRPSASHYIGAMGEWRRRRPCSAEGSRDRPARSCGKAEEFLGLVENSSITSPLTLAREETLEMGKKMGILEQQGVVQRFVSPSLRWMSLV